jgi:hypothetical protein
MEYKKEFPPRSEKRITKHFRLDYRSRQFVFDYLRFGRGINNSNENFDSEAVKIKIISTMLDNVQNGIDDYIAWNKIRKEKEKEKETIPPPPQKKKIKIIIKKKA